MAVFRVRSHCLWLLSAALALLIISISADEPETDADEVLTLTEDTFQTEVQKADLILVQFYAQWCAHCKTYNKQIYSKAARQLRPHGIILAKVDIDDSPQIKARLEITQIPYLKLFRKGMLFDYRGPAEEGGAETLVHYMLEEQAKRHLGEDPIITLTEENFDTITSTSELILVDFYADECFSCQRLEPHFVAAARRLHKNDPPVLFGKVKVPDQLEIAKRYGIGDYPLLLMFRYGERFDYMGPREENGIVEYMQRQAGPSSLLLQSARQAREFADSGETRAIGFFSMETGAELLQEFRDSGNLIRNDIRLGHSTDPAVAKEMGMPLESVVIFHPRHLVSQYESGFTTLPPLLHNTTATSLAETLLAHARPLVGQMTRDNFITSYRHRPMLIAFYDVKWDRDNIKATQYWHDLIASVAKDFRDSQLGFSVADEELFPNDLKAMGLEDWGEDVAVGIYAPGPLKYHMQEELTRESLRDFVSGFLSGDLAPYRSSEPPPRKNKGALVKTIVGSTFEKIVFDPKKNVMVMLCSPILPDCQNADQWYPKVAKKFEGVKDLVFGKMNAALNDPPVGTSYENLPAIFFSKLGSQEMEEVQPQPKDDADLVFYLKRRQNIKPVKASKKDSSKKNKDKPSKGKKDKPKDKPSKGKDKASKESKKDEL